MDSDARRLREEDELEAGAKWREMCNKAKAKELWQAKEGG